MNEPVGDRGGHSGGIEHFSPFGERQVGSQHGGLVVMPLTDQLEEEVQTL